MLFSVIYFSSVLVPSVTKEIDHITIVEKEDDYIVYSFLAEGKVLTHLDSMKYLSQQDKLSFIFDVLDSDTVDKASVLKESLIGENYDLRYYSSIYLSAMCNNLEAEVFKHLREYEMAKEYEVLKELLYVLGVYLDSNLLEAEMLEFFNELYIVHLKEAIELEANVEENTLNLLKSYLKVDKYTEVQNYLDSIKDSTYELSMIQFELYYKSNQFIHARKIANKILDSYKNIPSSDMGILNYWR
jgi:hypothetical protein